MADAREFTRDGWRYRLIGLDERAAQVASAATAAADLLDGRRRTALAALADWRGAHAERFAGEVSRVLGRAAAYHTSLCARAAYLSAFPDGASASAAQWRVVEAGQAAATVPAQPPGPVSCADPGVLEGYVAVSAGQPSALAALAGVVCLDGVTGTATRPRPLNELEQAGLLAVGLPPEVVGAQVKEDQRLLGTAEVAGLVPLAPVEATLAPLLAAAGALEAFTAAVARAFRAADDVKMARLAHLAAPGGLDATVARALVAQLLDPGASDDEQTVAVAALHELAQRDRGAAAAALGPSELDALVARAATMAQYGHTDQADAMVGPLAETVAVIVNDPSVPEATVTGLVERTSVYTQATLLSRATFAARFLHPSFDKVWLTKNPADARALALPYGHDLQVAALLGLARQPDTAAAVLNGHPERLRVVMGGDFPDGGEAAGAVLRAAYYDRVLSDLARDANDTTSRVESEAVLVQAVRDRSLHEPARIALAHIAGLHLEPISRVYDHGRIAGDRWAGVEQADVIGFYDDLFAVPEARTASAAALGHFAVGQLHLGARAAAQSTDADHRFDELRGRADRVGHVARLYDDVLTRRNERQGAIDALYRDVGESMVETAGGTVLGLVVAGPGGALAGGLLPLGTTVGHAVVPTRAPRHSEASLQYEVLRAAAGAQAILSQPSLVSGLDAGDRARLERPDFLNHVLNGDQQAIDEFNQILDENVAFAGFLSETTG